MTASERRPHDAPWLEPAGALIFFALALFLNRGVEWPWMWAIDLISCTGAALSYRRPGPGAFLVGLSLIASLVFSEPVASVGGMAFYINVFAAARKPLPWKTPLVIGFGGLAYLTLVRSAIERPVDRLPASIILLLVLALVYSGGLAFRYANNRIQREQDTGKQLLQDLRVSLARELHDSVAQTLSSAAMRANIVMGDPSLSPLAVDQLERIADECRSSAHDLRQLLSALRDEHERLAPPGPLADVVSLRAAVAAQAERLREEGFDVTSEIDVTKLSPARCQTLAAITVEATNNVLKHARPGTRCTLSIVQCTENVKGEFSNVMRGPHPHRHGFGLTGIQERLALLDGTSAITRKDGRWILQVRLPLGSESHDSWANSPASPEELFARPTNP